MLGYGYKCYKSVHMHFKIRFLKRSIKKSLKGSAWLFTLTLLFRELLIYKRAILSRAIHIIGVMLIISF